MTIVQGVKWAAIAGVLWFAYHLGGQSARTALEAQHAAQLAAVVKAMDANAAAQAAQLDKQQKVIDAYDATKDVPDPVDVGLATRVLLHACPAGGSGVPETRTVASGTPASAAQPFGDPSVGGRLQAVLDACTADARQMSAMIELAPH